MHGHQSELAARRTQFLQLVVRRVRDQRGQLGRVRDIQRLATHMRLGRRRAPPVQLVPALAPAAPVELGDRGSQSLRAVWSFGPLLVAADRQLPAHVGFVFQRVYPVRQRLGVQRAPPAAREVRVVEEDARPAVPGRGAPRRAAPVDRIHLGVVLEPAPEVLPRLRGQLAGRRADPLLVVGVGEERAVRAAPVGRPALDDAVAGLAEHAGPPGQQPRHVGPDEVLRIGRIGELDPLPRDVKSDLPASRICRVFDGDVDAHRVSVSPMRLGVLDVGSNTVHLLVVDAYLGAHPWPAHSEKSVLRLAEQIQPDGRLSKEGADALVAAVKYARKSAERLQTDDLLAFATSAVREATNSAEVLARVRQEAGVELRVLSGEGEARMTFLAVRRWFGWSAGRLLVLDIGGGSPELAAGIDDEADLAPSA